MTGSLEFNLAIECCRWNFAGVGAEAIAGLAKRIDWARFVRTVQFHRVQGLVWNALQPVLEELPPATRDSLAFDARAIAVANLHAAADCGALLSAFEAAGIPLLFVKGLTLGALAYGNPSLKAAIDIDILVDPGDLGQAADLLHSAAYRLQTPRESLNDAVLHAWHRGWKESVWIKALPPLQLDLHTHLADSRWLIPGINVRAPRQTVKVANGFELPTLADDQLFVYLAVHGASSAWFRLKWVSDFAAFVHGRTPDAIDQLYRRSQELGAGRAAGQALLLADALFRTLRGNPALRGKLEGDRTTRWLFRIAMRQLTGRREPAEPTERFLGTAAIHLTQFLLLPGIGYKLSEVSRQAGKVLTKRAARRAAGAGRGHDGTGPDGPSPQP